MADDFKYHIDHHARLLPPHELVEARAAAARGEADLTTAEDAAIAAALLTQRRLGLLGISDGEYRRPHRLSVVYDGIEGFGPALDGGPLAQLLGPELLPERRPLAAAPSARGRLVKHETDTLLSGTRRATMLTLPAPGFLAEVAGPHADELARIIREEVAAVAADGVMYVLLTNPLYGFLLSVRGRSRAAELGIDASAVVRRMVAVDALVLDGLETPENFRVGLDITTGGAAIDESGYDDADVRWFVGNQPYDRLCVEYPIAAGARFPLEPLVGGTVVSLGLVDVSTPRPEDVNEVVARVDEAAKLLDIDDLAISTNGAFTPGVGLGETEQRAKLQIVEMAARYFWGNEL